MSDLARCQARDSRVISAAFALPCSAAAVTMILRATPPSASAISPTRRFAEPRGVSRTRTRTPSRAAAKGKASVGEIFRHFDIEEAEQQQENDRRDVDAAEIRQEVANGSQRRLGQPVENLAELSDELVIGVDDPECDEPAHHRLRDHHPPIEIDYR